MDRVLILLVIASALVQAALADGAGRAFPVESENYAIQAFRKVNPGLVWDPTNFLVDLSGQYANCKQPRGQVTADRTTPEGATITVFVEITQGNASDIDNVDRYIRGVIDRWMDGRQLNNQMQTAKRFGCSVRPACSGTAVIACVFTDDKGTGRPPQPHPLPQPDRPTPPPPRPYYSPANIYDPTPKDDSNNNHLNVYGQKALAFTPQQYDIAESILGNKWDRSHFLEDLSGFETDCEMIGRHDWPFDKIKQTARERNMKISGQYGTAPNNNSTPDALRAILSKFKPLSNVKMMGCSIIPDCKRGSGMEVVISCLYQDA